MSALKKTENNGTYLAGLLEELSEIYVKCSKKKKKSWTHTRRKLFIIVIVNLLDVRPALHGAQHIAKSLTVSLAGFKFRKERGDLAGTGQLRAFGGAGSSVPSRGVQTRNGPTIPAPQKKKM